MRLKYYIRGIGIGIIFATLLLAISFYFGKVNLSKNEMTDEEIITRAKELGMVMPDEEEENTEAEADSNKTEEAEPLEESETADTSEAEDEESTEPEVTGEVAEVLESDEAKAIEQTEETDETTVTYVPFTVRGGESSDTVAYHLYREGLVDSSESFNEYMNSINVDERIQAGTFYIKQGSSYDDIVALLVNKDSRTTTPPTE